MLTRNSVIYYTHQHTLKNKGKVASIRKTGMETHDEIHSSHLDTLLPVCPKERIPHVHRDVKTLFFHIKQAFSNGLCTDSF